MYKNEKIFLSEDVGGREVLCKKLVENGAILVAHAGEANVVHVVNSFGGTLFEDLCKKGLRIVGVHCVNESLKDRKPLPRTAHPVYSRVLEGAVVCGAELTDDKAKMKTLVGYMHGTWVDDVTANTNAFLAVEYGGQQYWTALEYGTPVLKPSWIMECWEQQTVAHSKQHMLPTFSGCLISVTGLSTATRTSFQKMITALGGKYSEHLTRACTHLLADKPRGRKFQMAQVWGVNIVSTNWLFDSINYRGCLDPSKYEVSSVSSMGTDFDGDVVYAGKAGGRYSNYGVQAPIPRRGTILPYGAPLFVRRNRYTGAVAPPLYPPPFSPPHLTSANSTHRLTLPPPMYTPTHSSRITATSNTSNSINNNNINNNNSTINISNSNNNSINNNLNTQFHHTILSYFNKPKIDQLLIEANSSAMTYGSTAYRVMYNELTELLEMCDNILDKFPPEPSLSNNSTTPTIKHTSTTTPTPTFVTPTTTTTTTIPTPTFVHNTNNNNNRVSPRLARKMLVTADASTNTDMIASAIANSSAKAPTVTTTTTTATPADMHDESDDDTPNNADTTGIAATAATQSSEEK
jgi:hypothetical protein